MEINYTYSGKHRVWSPSEEYLKSCKIIKWTIDDGLGHSFNTYELELKVFSDGYPYSKYRSNIEFYPKYHYVYYVLFTEFDAMDPDNEDDVDVDVLMRSYFEKIGYDEWIQYACDALAADNLHVTIPYYLPEEIYVN